MIALPDFNSGAMENWGLITYRETAMLYKVGVSSETNKQRIAYVVAHELAHMVRMLTRVVRMVLIVVRMLTRVGRMVCIVIRMIPWTDQCVSHMARMFT